jgi:nucleoside-diphosphate-sugar epimerase
MNALVTGAGGFIGSHLIARLREDGVGVRALHGVRSNLPAGERDGVFRGDIRDAGAVGRAVEAGCDVVFHLAAKVHEVSSFQEGDPEYHAVNVQGAQIVLEVAAARGARRFVFFSSVKAMGEETDRCVDEATRERPTTEYGRSKLAAERMLKERGRELGVHVVCLRLPMVYGVGNRGNLLRMIRAIDRGRFPPPPLVGNRRSLVHVANVAQAAMLAARSAMGDGESYIVADAEPHGLRDMYEQICTSLGRRVPRWSVPEGALRTLGRAGDIIGRVRGRRFPVDSDAVAKMIGTAWYSSAKIERDLGYRPGIGLAEALPAIVEWYRSGADL